MAIWSNGALQLSNGWVIGFPGRSSRVALLGLGDTGLEQNLRDAVPRRSVANF